MIRIGRFKSEASVAAEKARREAYYKSPRHCEFCPEVIGYLSWLKYNAKTCGNRDCVNKACLKRRWKGRSAAQREHFARIQKIPSEAKREASRHNVAKGRAVRLANQIARRRARANGGDSV